MNVQFRNSFAKDLSNIENKSLLGKIQEVIESVEKAQSLQDISNLNDYNLNIPRYVDTFEAEDSID